MRRIAIVIVIFFYVNQIISQNNSPVLLDKQVVITSDLPSIDSTLKLFVDNTTAVYFDAGATNTSGTDMALILQARRNGMASIVFADGDRDLDSLNYTNSILSIGGPNMKIGVGTSSPSSKLDVNGTIQSSGPSSGVILVDPLNQKWLMTIDTLGNVKTTKM